MTAKPVWKIWIDTGGTFTDCIAVDPGGTLHRCKVLSNGSLRDRVESIDEDGNIRLQDAASRPPGFLNGFGFSVLGSGNGSEVIHHDPTTGAIRLRDDAVPGLAEGQAVELTSGQEAPLLAARLITGTGLREQLPPIAMRLATTRGTNALLERRGARSVHFITEGFEDLLRIGDQHRPDLFALHIERPAPLPEEIVGVRERLACDGAVLGPLDRETVQRRIDDLRQRGFSCASITLLHGHRNPAHELELEEMLVAAGFDSVARSSVLSPFQGLLRRSQTSAADAYLGPVISDYLRAVDCGLGGERESLHVMTSAGGLVTPASFRPMDSLLSGPAGGVVGAAITGRQFGVDKVIAFDMGGTSTDVARFDGDFEYVFSHQVGPVTLATPALAIETVAAGGGSICRVEQGRLAVGPESAGASPGPASYGAGGPLSLTDVNLLLGRLVAERFPIPIDVGAARSRFDDLRRQLADGDAGAEEEILEGLLRIADERMAEAIRHISVRKGIDPAAYSLVAFGGAGGQHACRVAELLGIEEVLLPADAGLLSAVGLGHAVVERFAQREVLRPLDDVAVLLKGWLGELEDEAVAALAVEGIDTVGLDAARRIVELRYLGQDAALEIEPEDGDDLRGAFEDAYFKLFSYRPSERGIEVVSLRVVVRDQSREVLPQTPENAAFHEAKGVGVQRCFLDGEWRDVPRFEIGELEPGAGVDGPALVQQEHSALVVPSRWHARVEANGGVRVRIDDASQPARRLRRERPRAVELELMCHRFSSIAREMGEMLQRTAVSTNIKEREDFSCTLLDAGGRLVVNAPHIPVHLGAMGLCVRELVAHRAMAPGDVVVTNHPAYGGSHLPDVTLVAPVHVNDRLLGYVACRAHHAEIGGIRPGSVPPDARSLAEEGVVIPPTLLLEGGEPRWERLEELLTGGRWPTRTPADNLADLRAMLAAILRGREALAGLARTLEIDHVVEHMDALREMAAREVADALRTIAGWRPSRASAARRRVATGRGIHDRR